MAYLDDTGLAYFWGKIKAWANSVFALISHTHAASDVTAMTGYSRPSTGSAIAASDTLNSAIGKLEAKVDIYDDSNVVHRTGDETVDGVKTFYGAFSTDASGLAVLNTNVTKGTIPSITNYVSIPLLGNNGRFGLLETAVNSQGDVSTYIAAYKNVANEDGAFFTLTYPSSGDPYSRMGKVVTCNNIIKHQLSNEELVIIGGTLETSGTQGAKIVLRGGNHPNYNGGSFLIQARNADNSHQGNLEGHADGYLSWDGYFHLADLLHLDRGGRCAAVKEPAITKGTAPSNTLWTYIEFTDKNDERLSYVSNVYMSDKTNRIQLTVRKAVNASDTDENSIGIGYDSSGNVYTYAPTPVTSDNSSKIATTAFVKNQNYATVNTDETITGHKIFKYWLATQASFYLSNTSLVKRTIPSSYTGQYIYFEDKNSNNLSAITFAIDTSGQSILTLGVYDFGKTSTSLAFAVGCSCDYNAGSSGTPYNFRAFSDNNVTLGTTSRRFKQLYAGTTTISTSDERLKQNIEIIPDNVLDVWEDVSFCQFKMRDAVEEKGNSARLHNGLIAQQIEKIFNSKGLDASDYGLFCYDSWEHKDASIDEKGSVIEEELLAGDRYSLRYEEALCMEAAYMRRENARLKKRVADLEERLAALELKVS